MPNPIFPIRDDYEALVVKIKGRQKGSFNGLYPVLDMPQIFLPAIRHFKSQE